MPPQEDLPALFARILDDIADGAITYVAVTVVQSDGTIAQHTANLTQPANDTLAA